MHVVKLQFYSHKEFVLKEFLFYPNGILNDLAPLLSNNNLFAFFTEFSHW